MTSGHQTIAYLRRLSIVMLLIAGWIAQMLPQQAVPSQSGAVSAANDSEAKQYPCQGGTCGCQTAEQCWKSCCCTTREERILWAKRHQITIDPMLIGEQVVHTKTDSVCCSARPKVAATTHACCVTESTQTKIASQTSECCSAHKTKTSATKADETIPRMSPWECQGKSIVWMLVTIAVDCPQETVRDALSNGQRRSPIADLHAISHSLKPSLPPPECC